MTNIKSLKMLSYSLLITTMSFNLNISKVAAQRLSSSQCQQAHNRIAQSYAQNQPSPINANAYQQWMNSLMATIRQFEAKNPECPSVLRSSGSNNKVRNNNSQDVFIQQRQREHDTRMKAYCRGRGGEWNYRTNDCDF